MKKMKSITTLVAGCATTMFSMAVLAQDGGFVGAQEHVTGQASAVSIIALTIAFALGILLTVGGVLSILKLNKQQAQDEDKRKWFYLIIVGVLCLAIGAVITFTSGVLNTSDSQSTVIQKEEFGL
ncbi:DUF308 domain-containing protein [Idiomarina abyssalis]|uniref:DUF308 domain-containing protein n=1 Tax=Idiomarina abyssalis TaxID=86102 RepID=A0A8I1GE46_9GAMM|nr:DUF308 domain-containing protein [Idiomarina abyssalis]MBJ7265575.1 DUF308 domain-containing protein [Idiomarina abyssalis]MBJ7316751.1 DUF308 domain-containing protein [Idiomarina abyssalis]